MHAFGARVYGLRILSLIALLLAAIQIVYFLSLLYQMAWKYFMVGQFKNLAFLMRDSVLIYLIFGAGCLALLAVCGARHSWARLWKGVIWAEVIVVAGFFILLALGVIVIIP